MSKKDQLTDIHNSGKSYIIYKSKKGFDLYTNFSKKIILNNNNIDGFLNKKHKSIPGNINLYIGFFGYEILNKLIGIKIPKQKSIKFPKGIFYKPEKKISLRKGNHLQVILLFLFQTCWKDIHLQDPGVSYICRNPRK